MRIHIVRPGDTLWQLAKRYNVPLQRLIDANPQIQDPNQLRVGEKIRIPTGGVPVQPPSVPEQPARPGRPDHDLPDRGDYPMPDREWERWTPGYMPELPGIPSVPYPPAGGGMHGGYSYPPMPGMGHQYPGKGYPMPGMEYQYPGMGYPMPGMGCQTPMMNYPMYGMPYPGHHGMPGYTGPYAMESSPWMPPYQTYGDAEMAESSSSSA